jgi:HEAT repeat protein
VGLAGLGLCGCAVTWDDVTSRDFHAKDFFAKPEDPLVVLRDSKDGDKRAKAFRALKEPRQNGGSEQDQDFVLDLLKTAATQESRYYVRLEAVRKLGEFKDPRAVPPLVDAYFKADALKTASAGPEMKGLVSTLRCEVLRGLGNNGNPAAADHLVWVLKQGPVEGPEADRRQVLDERITAARALRNYPQANSTDALALVLKTEKDVALRDAATDSLQACTGKKLPADYAAWDDYLHRQGGNRPEMLAAEKKKGIMEYILTGFGGKP